MSRTGKVDGERIAAWLAVLGVHLLFWWILTHATTVSAALGHDRRCAAGELDRSATACLYRSSHPQPQRHPSCATARRSRRRQRRIPCRTRSPAEVPVAMSAVFIDQGRRWAEAQTRRRRFRARSAGASQCCACRDGGPTRSACAIRFRRRRVLRRIGKVFAGADYTHRSLPADPREHRRPRPGRRQRAAAGGIAPSARVLSLTHCH